MSISYDHYLKIQKVSGSFVYAGIGLIADTKTHVTLPTLSLSWMHGIGLKKKSSSGHCQVRMYAIAIIRSSLKHIANCDLNKDQ